MKRSFSLLHIKFGLIRQSVRTKQKYISKDNTYFKYTSSVCPLISHEKLKAVFFHGSRIRIRMLVKDSDKSNRMESIDAWYRVTNKIGRTVLKT